MLDCWLRLSQEKPSTLGGAHAHTPQQASRSQSKLNTGYNYGASLDYVLLPSSLLGLSVLLRCTLAASFAASSTLAFLLPCVATRYGWLALTLVIRSASIIIIIVVVVVVVISIITTLTRLVITRALLGTAGSRVITVIKNGITLCEKFKSNNVRVFKRPPVVAENNNDVRFQWKF